MRRCFTLIAALTLVAASVGLASAQGGRGRGFGQLLGGGLQLLTIAEVQQELKMTQPQIDKVQAKQQEMREAMREIFQSAGGPQNFQQMSAEEREKLFARVQEVQKKAVADILDEKQQKRFRQLELQSMGPRALSRRDVAEELKLTKEQQDKIRSIQQQALQEQQAAMQGVDFQNATPEDRQKFREKMEGIAKATSDKITALLTEEQKKSWTAMLGEPFKFPARGPGRFGPGRPL